MCTRMVHPEHGAMHAYGKGEVDRLEAIGWSVEDAQSPAVVTAEDKQAEATAPRRRGRPPKAE